MIKFKVLKLNYKLVLTFLLIIIILSLFFVYNYVNANTEPCINLPIIMYHSILKSKSGDYIVHPSVLEKDLQYIQEKGYTAITMTDLINYVYEDARSP